MFSLPFLVMMCQVVRCWCGVAPLLNVSSELVIFTEEQSLLSLSCQGSQPLHWNWTSSIQADDFFLNINSSTQAVTDYPYVSTFTVKTPQPVDSGSYYCYYSDATNLVTDEQNVDATYVYVHDGISSFVDDVFHKNLLVATDETLELSCSTTLPNITVKLMKDGQDISWQAQWDPRIGFIRRGLVIQDSGMYTCQSSFNGDKMLFFVQVHPASTKLPQPNIEKGLNQHFVEGYGFSLNCTMVKEANVAFHWTYPNSGKMYEIKYSIEEMRSTLIVPKASEADTGRYTCSVTAPQIQGNSNSMDIKVKKSMESYVNMFGSEMIKAAEGSLLNWKVEVYAFPPDPIIVYRDWKGEVIRKDDRVTLDYRPLEAASWLRIKNLTSGDFGNYTVTGNTTDGKASDSIRVFIQVKSPPLVRMTDVPLFLTQGQKLQITCLITGYPLPTVNLEFLACPLGPVNCSSEFENAQIMNETTSVLAPGNFIKTMAIFSPSVSGVLRCRANNTLATRNTTAAIKITDIGGTFVLRHSGQNRTTEVTDPKQQQSVVVITNDDFLLLCGGSKFDYKSIHLVHSPLSVSTGVPIHGNETEFSLLKQVIAKKVTKELGGNYQCTAQPRDGQLRMIKTMTIRVLEEAPVKFKNDSNMRRNDTFVVKENEPFFLNCTVSGTPRPTIHWKKDGKLLSPDSAFFDSETTILSQDAQRLEMKYVFKEKHIGVYSCIATNRVSQLLGTLTLNVPRPGLSTGARVALVMTCLGIGALFIIVVILMKRVKTERKFRKSFRQNELYLFEKGNVGQLNPDCPADEQAELLPYGQEWEVPRQHITIGKQLGAGAFGRVVKATVTGLEGPAATPVAVKMCKSQADASQVRALTLELKIMVHLGKHLNIVNLMGANTEHVGRGELWILVEYCRFGNLLVFMQRHRKNYINQVDAVTDRIDHTKVTVDPGTLLSPLSPSARGGYQTSRDSSNNGFLTHNGTEFVLGSPPQGHQTACKRLLSTEKNIHPASPTPLDHDYMNATQELRSVNGGPEHKHEASSSCEEAHFHQAPANLSPHSDYRGNDMKSLSSDATVSQHPSSPFYPLSPTGSPHMGDLALDSQGNPFLHEVGSVPGVTAPFTTSDLICWAWQVAQGMDYLVSRNILHGDLAARNLLLADDNVVKISDFGLSREVYKKDVYLKKGDDLMPIKWISVEAIRDRIFSVQSDVWAFGVTLWEMFSLGSMPYPGIEVNKDFLPLLEEGFRMKCPKYANREIYDLMLNCWEAEPMQRPSFREAAERLGAMMIPDLKGEYMRMNEPYLKMNQERFQQETDYLNMFTNPDFECMTRGEEQEQFSPHYVNIMEASNSARGSSPAAVTSPGSQLYCNMGGSITASSSASPNAHYLPMSSTQGSPRLISDIFSPRHTEDSRFTFPCGEESFTLREPTSKEKDTNSDAEDKEAIENSTLLSHDAHTAPEGSLS